ncbi:MAG: class I SAM-dependent methyltransferase [Wenzhouxiangellaceae bacterium]
MPQNIFDDPDFFSSYMRIRLNAAGHNELIEKPALISLLPELMDAHVLDLGCGHGDLCRYMVKQGASHITGIDVSGEMITCARGYGENDRIDYHQQDMATVEVPAASLDLVTSSLAIHYVEDYPALVSRVYSLLKPGGYFVFSVEHPIYTAPSSGPGPSWLDDDQQQRRYWKLDAYGDESQRVVDWLVNGVQKYHRKTETYINTLIDQGFNICKILEPQPGDDALAINPELAYEINRPPFLLIKAQKCSDEHVA